MKPTMSKDGALRFNLRPVFRVGADELREAFCCEFASRHWEVANSDNVAMAIESELRKYASRKAILELATEALVDEGNSHYWTWAEENREEFVRQLREQVRVLVEKKFPDLKKGVIS